MKGKPPFESASSGKPWVTRLRRRRTWAAVVLSSALLIAGAAAWLTEPAYRATARLVLEGKTLPADLDDSGVADHAAEHLRARHARVLADGAAALDAERIAVALVEWTIAAAGAEGPRSVSLTFDVAVDGNESRAAESAARALVERYLADDTHTSVAAPAPSPALTAARRETDRLAAALGESQSRLDSFRVDHRAALEPLSDAESEIAARADSERAAIERQVEALQARGVELDQALREMQQGAYRAGRSALTSDNFTALQSRWAVLRGRLGSDHPEAVALGNEIRELQAQVDQRIATATNELAQAQAELTSLERTYPIDHPDVVRQAHVVSALESRLEPLRIRGLTNSERAYIESLALERREIDGRLDELRRAQASLVANVADYEARAAEAPLLAQQYLALQAEVETARALYDAAHERQQAHEAELETALAQKPGRLRLVSAPQTRRTFMSHPAAILGLGALTALFGAAAVVVLLERIDKRIAGAAAIERAEGCAPLAHIPFIELATT